MRRIGVLMPFAEGDPEGLARSVALQQGLEKLGWTIGRNVQIDYHWGIRDVEKAQAAIAELLAFAPDAIIASTSQTVAALQRATVTVPIVFTGTYEPVAQGFVRSLAHPGGNITGFTNVEATIGAKWLGLLKEIAPHVTRVAFMFDPNNPGPMQTSRSAAAAAPSHAMSLVMAPVDGPTEIEAAMRMLGSEFQCRRSVDQRSHSPVFARKTRKKTIEKARVFVCAAELGPVHTGGGPWGGAGGGGDGTLPLYYISKLENGTRN